MPFSGSMSSWLFQEIREKRGLAYAIYSYLTSYRDTGLFGIYVGTEAKRSVKSWAHPGRDGAFLRELLTEKELRSAKELIKGIFSSDGKYGQSDDRTGQERDLIREARAAEEVVEKIDAVGREEIRSLAGDCSGPIPDDRGDWSGRRRGPGGLAASENDHMLRCAALFVIAAYEKVRSLLSACAPCL